MLPNKRSLQVLAMRSLCLAVLGAFVRVLPWPLVGLFSLGFRVKISLGPSGNRAVRDLSLLSRLLFGTVCLSEPSELALMTY